MKTATSMRAASAAAAVSAPWPTSPSPARTTSCSAMIATAAPSRHSALPAGRPSCPVRPWRPRHAPAALMPGLCAGSVHGQGTGTCTVHPGRLSITKTCTHGIFLEIEHVQDQSCLYTRGR